MTLAWWILNSPSLEATLDRMEVLSYVQAGCAALLFVLLIIRLILLIRHD